jgi:hypothetical protein
MSAQLLAGGDATISPDAALFAAARLERDRRAEAFPAKIRAGADAERLSIEYQCWVAIAEWLEGGRFFSFAGGADPDRADAPVIRLAELEAAAQDALARRSAKLEALEGQTNVTPETLGALRQRRSCLFIIHRRLALRRQSVDAINAELRARREQAAVA